MIHDTGNFTHDVTTLNVAVRRGKTVSLIVPVSFPGAKIETITERVET